MKKPITIPFEELPEARNWRVGYTYRVKMVLKQVGMSEDGASFEVLDATSLEKNEARRSYLGSDSGAYGGK